MVKGRRLIKILMLALLYSVPSISAIAQTSEHQRIGVERKTDWELGFEFGSGMTNEACDSIDYLFVDSYAAVDMTLAKSWTASFYAPLSSRFIVGDGVRKAAATGLGDLELSAGWTGRVADTRVSASLRATAPTGQWSDYASADLLENRDERDACLAGNQN